MRREVEEVQNEVKRRNAEGSKGETGERHGVDEEDGVVVLSRMLDGLHASGNGAAEADLISKLGSPLPADGSRPSTNGVRCPQFRRLELYILT